MISSIAGSALDFARSDHIHVKIDSNNEIFAMDINFKNKLIDNFPHFYLKNKDNIWIPQGWHNLIWKLSENLNKLIPSEKENYYVSQVKEKFGGLRYYMFKATKEMIEIINYTEDESYNICINCGNKKIDKMKECNNSKKYDYNTLCNNCKIIKNIIE